MSAHLEAQDDGDGYDEDGGVADDVREGAEAVENLYHRRLVRDIWRVLGAVSLLLLLRWNAA